MIAKNNTMKSIEIPIHSFVDLITNSSTEVYISADERTVKTIKEIIQNILQLGGSKFNVDELFVIKLMIESGEFYDYKTDKCILFEDTDYFSEEGQKIWKECGGEENTPKLYVKVEAKVSDDKLAVETAKILSSLHRLFNINAEYNG